MPAFKSYIYYEKLTFPFGIWGFQCRRHEFLCLYRFKMWWMIPRIGKSGSEVPVETQMLLLKVAEESALNDESSADQDTDRSYYILILPVLDGSFRATLQGTSQNELQLCAESGQFCLIIGVPFGYV